jgi:hypothetical protein
LNRPSIIQRRETYPLAVENVTQVLDCKGSAAVEKNHLVMSLMWLGVKLN